MKRQALPIHEIDARLGVLGGDDQVEFRHEMDVCNSRLNKAQTELGIASALGGLVVATESWDLTLRILETDGWEESLKLAGERYSRTNS